jgi:hypothetical protein
VVRVLTEKVGASFSLGGLSGGVDVGELLGGVSR